MTNFCINKSSGKIKQKGKIISIQTKGQQSCNKIIM